jgi:hypothetical protein
VLAKTGEELDIHMHGWLVPFLACNKVPSLGGSGQWTWTPADDLHYTRKASEQQATESSVAQGMLDRTLCHGYQPWR